MSIRELTTEPLEGAWKNTALLNYEIAKKLELRIEELEREREGIIVTQSPDPVAEWAKLCKRFNEAQFRIEELERERTDSLSWDKWRHLLTEVSRLREALSWLDGLNEDADEALLRMRIDRARALSEEPQ